VNIQHIDPIGSALVLVGAIFVYGARKIALFVFKVSEEQTTRLILATKLVGLVIGILGMLKIMNIL